MQAGTTVSQETLTHRSGSISRQTAPIEKETNVETVSCAGGQYCYSIGGVVGQKFSRMEKPTKKKWSKDAPGWRVAVGGLNLEGYCTNSSCRANRKLVVYQWGFKNSGIFNYHDNEHECACPLCGKYVSPITCGFANCEWKFTGSKKIANGQKPEQVDSGWQVALGDGYTTFEDKLTQLATWNNLQIEVKALNAEKSQQQAALYA